jgi:hypothetical protein
MTYSSSSLKNANKENVIINKKVQIPFFKRAGHLIEKQN